MRACSLAPGDASQKPSRDQFRAAVVVGHVEGIEARSGVFEHCRRSRLPVERRAVALHIGDLPEAGHNAADLESGRKRDTIRRVGHRRPYKSQAARASPPLWLGDLRLQRVDVVGAHFPDRRHLAVRDLP